MHIETRVDKDGQASLPLKRAKDVVIERVVLALDNLRSCRVVNMNHGWISAAPFRTHVASDRHVTAGTSVHVCNVEDLSGPLALDHGREGHEFGAFKADVQKIVRLAAGRICEDGARAKGTRPKLHTVRIDGTDLTGFQAPRGAINRRLREAPNAG
ncbi:MAG TPA: hypothetical protein VI137_11000 [Pseudolabrys sp.]